VMVIKHSSCKRRLSQSWPLFRKKEFKKFCVLHVAIDYILPLIVFIVDIIEMFKTN
jgi:hypothetical protein